MSSDIDRRRTALEGRWRTWVPRSLAECYDVVAEDHPDRPFVITDHAGLSYGDIHDWSVRLARGLIGIGVEPGDPVGLLIDNRAELVALKLAVARVGAIAVPLNFSYRPLELAAALRHARVRVLITIARSLSADFLTTLDDIVPGWETGVSSLALPDLTRVVLIDGARAGALDLGELCERGHGVSPDAVSRRTAAVDPDGVGDIVFTSGTSGHPVAAELTHDMVLRSGYGSAFHRGFDDAWRVCFALPLYHVFGYVEGLIAAMFAAGAVIPRQVFNPATLLEAVQTHRAREVLMVPTMTVAVVEQAARKSYDLSCLESIFSAAAPAPVWLWQRVQQELAPERVFTGYGQTEVSAATTLTLPEDDLDVVSDTVGVPKLGGIAAPEGFDGHLAAYRTLDPFTAEVLPPGTEGELAARGPIVSRGYHNDPEQNANAYDADGWLRTGDLGFIGPDGRLRLTGRARELFKVGGELVSPKEIEDVLTAQPGVGQAYVAGVADERMGEVGWAWIVPDGEAEVDVALLRRRCRDRLAPFKVPRQVVLVAAEELPTTTTGKVQKYRLRESAARGG